MHDHIPTRMENPPVFRISLPGPQAAADLLSRGGSSEARRGEEFARILRFGHSPFTDEQRVYPGNFTAGACRYPGPGSLQRIPDTDSLISEMTVHPVAASSSCFRAGRSITDAFISRAASWVRICCRLSSAEVRSRRSPCRWISKIRLRSRSADSR
jgi:hypothetical protein